MSPRSRLMVTLLATCAVAASAQAGNLRWPGYREGQSPPPASTAAPAPEPERDAPGAFANIGYADWSDSEPEYRLYPGDELDITVPSAPELNKTVTVQPDGRVSLPLIQPVMAADRTIPQLQDALTAAYATQLRRPQVSVAVKTAQPLKVFVMGEVDKSGVYDMPGDINALQAIALAGGFKSSARTHKIVVIRRGPGGTAMARTVDLDQVMKNPAGRDLVPLRRFDVIVVPRTGVAQVGVYMQQFRDLLPLQFSYAINGVSQ
ncbi:polysaccharide export outer membrane protein [Caulobacter ginsengisoli]|uniref:Polysaccharide export outer membrane protein n=1 Tax=Caulobacter ginsengisoli TaxID=400775 RepID=A0ABU0IQ34_9CAUL|nr:polysaccharide biosynthesis/export family protein [Caulobacter ginsengisoli]MDQ0464123.1 polysaccharide export outer membrane protein [Caulobacter ginsengisoli]